MDNQELNNIERRLGEYVAWCEHNNDLCPMKQWTHETISKLIKEVRILQKEEHR